MKLSYNAAIIEGGIKLPPPWGQKWGYFTEKIKFNQAVCAVKKKT
jgi:hypothetical protein